MSIILKDKLESINLFVTPQFTPMGRTGSYYYNLKATHWIIPYKLYKSKSQPLRRLTTRNFIGFHTMHAEEYYLGGILKLKVPNMSTPSYRRVPNMSTPSY